MCRASLCDGDPGLEAASCLPSSSQLHCVQLKENYMLQLESHSDFNGECKPHATTGHKMTVGQGLMHDWIAEPTWIVPICTISSCWCCRCNSWCWFSNNSIFFSKESTISEIWDIQWAFRYFITKLTFAFIPTNRFRIFLYYWWP